MRMLLLLGCALLLGACNINANADATERSRADALTQSTCAQRGILPGDARYDACRRSMATAAGQPLIEGTGALTASGSGTPTGELIMNPYSTRPQRGVYGSGI